VQTETEPLLDAAGLGALRVALDEFTGEAVHDALGLVGRAAQERGDVEGALRELAGDDRVSTLVKLFLLGGAVPADDATAALDPLSPAEATKLIESTDGHSRARYEIRPYSEDGGPDWLVVSDFGSDVRPGPVADDHVLGIGGASLTLAQSTMRPPVRRALDIGVGSGVQSLHLARHATSVTATDLSRRALRMAATTAALSSVTWDLRQGSLLEPVADETFDLIVANPPFVVSPGLLPGAGGHEYRDSGMVGDGVCRALIRGIPSRLNPGGSASLLANWIVPSDGDWAARLGEWLSGSACDAWIWQREVLSPGEYVTLWLRDAGERPGSPAWIAKYEHWVAWFERTEVVAVGMGLVTLWKPVVDGGTILVCEDVPQAVQQPAGTHLPAWIARQRWLRDTSDRALLDAVFLPAPDLIRARFDLHQDGWQRARIELRQSHGMRWELETDDAIARLVGACDGQLPLRIAVEVLASSLDMSADELGELAIPAIRDLISRGFLEPAQLS
jgi:hypothetical protein